MYRDTSEEDEEHEQPLEVLAEGAEEGSFTDTIAHGCESDVAETVENDYEGDPDVPGVDVILVDIWSVALALLKFRMRSGRYIHPLYHPIKK